MKEIMKWNNEARKYEPHQIPNDWDIRAYCYDMDEVINCVHCGKKIKYGDGYTSRRYHTALGFGYAECEVCYDDYLTQEVLR